MRINERKSIRMPSYDYSLPNYYFVTICVKNRECLLGNISDGQVVLSEWGRVVQFWWQQIPVRYRDVILDEFVIMPDHFHGIIDSTRLFPVGAIHELPLRDDIYSRRKMLLPKIIGYFKMNSAKQINLMRDNSGQTFWQRNYYERIIRDERELENARIYIRSNPVLAH